ncbi:MAG: transposase [Steroidobacteraceae bacterium]
MTARLRTESRAEKPHLRGSVSQLTRATGATGAVTLIQRFGSAPNLNIHFHMLALDGAYRVGARPPVFRRIAPPSEAELQALIERLARRVGRTLERQGLLVRDIENDFLETRPEEGGAMDDLIGHSITYRVAVGPRARQKVFTLQTVPVREVEPRPGVAQFAGFSLHAGIGVEAAQRVKLERLARYVSAGAAAAGASDPLSRGVCPACGGDAGGLGSGGGEPAGFRGRAAAAAAARGDDLGGAVEAGVRG